MLQAWGKGWSGFLRPLGPRRHCPTGVGSSGGGWVRFGSFGVRRDFVEVCVGGSKEGLARSNEEVIFFGGVDSIAGL